MRGLSALMTRASIRFQYARQGPAEPGTSGIGPAHGDDALEPIRDSIEPSRPIYLVLCIGNVNARPSVANEISRLEDGAGRGRPRKFRVAAAWISAVDGE